MGGLSCTDEAHHFHLREEIFIPHRGHRHRSAVSFFTNEVKFIQAFPVLNRENAAGMHSSGGSSVGHDTLIGLLFLRPQR